jgi:hypothetical protein
MLEVSFLPARGMIITISHDDIFNANTRRRSLLLSRLLSALDFPLTVLPSPLLRFIFLGSLRGSRPLAQLHSSLLAWLLACKWTLRDRCALYHVDRKTVGQPWHFSLMSLEMDDSPGEMAAGLGIKLAATKLAKWIFTYPD